MASAGEINLDAFIPHYNVIHMRDSLYGSKKLLCNVSDLNCNGLRILDHPLKFFLGSQSHTLALIHNEDTVAELLHLLHIMRRINYSCPFPVKLLYPLKDIVSALGINCHSRLIEENELWLVGNPAGYVKSS